MLQMRLVVNGTTLRVEYLSLKKDLCFVEFDISDSTLQMRLISHQIQDVDGLLDEFEVTGNLGLLIRRIRRGFA